MFEVLWNLGSFILALSILVAVHEYGHFWVARKAGVKVLRFSIGFGKPLLRWHDKLGTEYVVAAIPLGGYVKMLDERVEEVPVAERHLSFNSKSVLARIAIVSAGPLANFLFAIFALALMYFIGIQTVKPVIGDVTVGSRAELAGLSAEQELVKIGERDIENWQDATFALMQHLGDESVPVTVRGAGQLDQIKTLNLDGWKLDKQDQSPLAAVGITPFSPAVRLELAQIAPGSAAELAGLATGDRLVAIDEMKLERWQQLVEVVRNSPDKPLAFAVLRDGRALTLLVTPQNRPTKDGFSQGYLGVVPVVEPWPESYIVTREYGPLDSLWRGTEKTGQLVSLSFEMIGNLVTGQVSVKNLSGPVGIAVGAGTSVSYGLVAFLSFLALISVNLGVFNLLPLPVLDGGHLMYYLIELIRKKPVSEKTQELGFKIGALVLILLTCFALLNDFSRL